MNRTYDSGCGIEAMRIEGGDLAARVLILPALFDEANRMRRTTVQLMRALTAHGIGSALPDLPGTGESVTDTADVTWGAWLEATRAAATAGATDPPLTVAIRGGALLDAACAAHPHAARWRLSPEPGARLLRDLDRARQVGGGADAYALASDFRAALQAATPADLPRLRTLRIVGDPAPADRHVDAPRLWRQAESGEDIGFVTTLAADIAAWVRSCAP